uniref:Uncharacterized protein n=1 Tax=Anguilla anguilla TaxID=7936 RepID=A0A0E9UAL8_ANGAN
MRQGGTISPHCSGNTHKYE